MKKIIITVLGICSFGVQAQVAIGKTAADGSESPVTAPANSSVSLELGNATGGTKGIILPYVADCTTMSSAVAGTIVYDVKTQKIKYGQGASAGATSVGTWVDLSNGATSPSTAVATLAASDQSGSQAIIGTATGAPAGVLVLNDPNKAMILPRVSTYDQIPNPSPGMMVYCTTTQTLAVYNGSQWSFWTHN